MRISLSFLFWGYAIAYSIHIVEESSLAGGFVNMVKENIWADYDMKNFFWFNTFLYLTNITGIILYDVYGGSWIVFPLSLAWMFVTNGIWHLIGSIITKKYSPGLVTSPIYWILMYMIIRYNKVNAIISNSQMIISFIFGLSITILMIGSLFVAKKLFATKD
ncbi:HXXEE domain-containing protein [Halonatronum saccharophilum]|uniref:HXXEE domain-containing protein n=1 Tax=Halonatronum saccharophilum TaxID=150060 RepID=UPI00048A3391|nr:HXXEE domain-containing protein [Halonatronum saccharophilum]